MAHPIGDLAVYHTFCDDLDLDLPSLSDNDVISERYEDGYKRRDLGMYERYERN